MSGLICDVLSGLGFNPGFCKNEKEEQQETKVAYQEDPEARSFLEKLLWGTEVEGAVGCHKKSDGEILDEAHRRLEDKNPKIQKMKMPGFDVVSQMQTAYPQLRAQGQGWVDFNGNGEKDPTEQLTDADENGEVGNEMDYYAFIGVNSQYIRKEIFEEALNVNLNTFQDANQELPKRMYAGYAIGQMKSKRAIPIFINSLTDPEDQIRKISMLALLTIGRDAIPGLIEALQEPDENTWKGAAAVFISMGKPTIPYLIGLFENDSDQVCLRVAAILMQIGEEATPALITALKIPREAPSNSVIVALADIGKQSKLTRLALIDALKLPDQPTNSHASVALVKIGKDAVPELIEELKKCSGETCNNVATTLIMIGKDAIRPLLQSLNNSEEKTQKDIATVLLMIGEVCIPVLIEELKGPDKEVNKTVVFVLKGFGKKAIPYLIEALRTCAGETCHKIGKVMVLFGDDMVRPLASNDIKNTNKEFEKAAATVLAQVGKKQISFLVQSLKTASAEMQVPIIGALAIIGEKAVPELIKALRNPNKNLRRCAALTLGVIKDKRAIPALRQLSNDPDLEISTTAKEVIKKIEERTEDDQ